jgi:hypothetical protein
VLARVETSEQLRSRTFEVYIQSQLSTSHGKVNVAVYIYHEQGPMFLVI